MTRSGQTIAILPRRIAVPIALLLFLHSASAAHAGLMLPDNDNSLCLGVAADPEGEATIALEAARPNSPESEKQLPAPLAETPAEISEGVFQSGTGGASAPSGGSISVSFSSSALFAAGSAVDHWAVSGFRQWRESAPRLPDPLSCRLLDPPRQSA